MSITSKKFLSLTLPSPEAENKKVLVLLSATFERFFFLGSFIHKNFYVMPLSTKFIFIPYTIYSFLCIKSREIIIIVTHQQA